MENEYLNPGFENYSKEKRSDDYVFMNPEVAPAGAKVESMDDENYRKLADDEVNNVVVMRKINSISNHLSDEAQKKFLWAAAASVITLGTIFSLIGNRDLTNSITSHISYLGGFAEFKEVIKTLTNGNIIGIAASAIGWVETIKHKHNQKDLQAMLDKEVKNQPINFLEVNNVKEEVTEGRAR